MPDYECPTCGGGFPSAAADGTCPWCDEPMAGREADAPTTSLEPSRFAREATVDTPPTTRPLSDDLDIDTTTSGFRFGGDAT